MPGWECVTRLQLESISSIPTQIEVQEIQETHVPPSNVNLPQGNHSEDTDEGQHREEEEEEEEGQHVIEVTNDERNDDQAIPPKYTIYGVGAGSQDQGISLVGVGSFEEETLPICFDKTKKVHMLAVLNHLVRSTRLLTKLVPRQMFTTLSLDNKGPNHHLKVAHDLICEVKNLYPNYFPLFNLLKQEFGNVVLQAVVVADEGTRLV